MDMGASRWSGRLSKMPAACALGGMDRGVGGRGD